MGENQSLPGGLGLKAKRSPRSHTGGGKGGQIRCQRREQRAAKVQGRAPSLRGCQCSREKALQSSTLPGQAHPSLSPPPPLYKVAAQTRAKGSCSLPTPPQPFTQNPSPAHSLQHHYLTHCRYEAANQGTRLFSANHCRVPLANRETFLKRPAKTPRQFGSVMGWARDCKG